MICTLVENLLDLYLDGRLVAFQARLVERHLAACPDCATRLASLKKVRQELRDLLTPEPPVDFKAGLKAALLEAGEREEDLSGLGESQSQRTFERLLVSYARGGAEEEVLDLHFAAIGNFEGDPPSVRMAEEENSGQR